MADDVVTVEVPTDTTNDENEPSVEVGDTNVTVITPNEPDDDSSKVNNDDNTDTDLALLVGALAERVSALESQMAETAAVADVAADVAEEVAEELVESEAEEPEDSAPGKPHWFFRRASDIRKGDN